MEKRINLSRTIWELQTRFAESPDAAFQRNAHKKAEFDTLASDEVAESLLKTHHNYYEFGDKPSKKLAHQIQQSVSPQQITQLNITDGMTTSPKSINDQFRDFYSLL